MNWLLLSAAALGLACVALRRYTPWLGHLLKPGLDAARQRLVLRKPTTLDRLIEDLRQEKDALERHRLLGAIVDESHRQRSDAAVNKVFLRFAGMHVKELPKMAEALKKAHGGKLPPVPAFKLLVAALEEEGRQEEAALIRKRAEALGMIDGSKVESEDRIKKSEKKKTIPRPPAKKSGQRRASGRVKRGS